MKTLDNQAVVSRVGELLVDATKNPMSVKNFNDTFAATGGNIVHDLNNYWRRQLMSVQADTTTERTCLVDDASPEDWLCHFSEHIIPTIRRFGLPDGN